MSEGRRRRFGVLSLLVVVSLLGSAFLADAASAKMSKAQKHAIKKKLNRAIKKNPRVVQKRWFLKQASIVNYSLPATIRIQPAANQQGDFVANDDQPGGADKATLDLGPSLGSRVVGLGGYVRATIKFNDAFDSGAIGDVKVDIPSGDSAITTTSVPLLTNADVSNLNGAFNETETVIYDAGSTSGDFTFTVNGTPVGPIAYNATSGDLQSALDTALGAGKTYVAGPLAVPALVSPLTVDSTAFAIMFTGSLGNQDVTTAISANTLSGGPADAAAIAPRQNGSAGPAGDQGCANFAGDGTPLDVDKLSQLSDSNTPGVDNNLGEGPFSPELGTEAADTVLRTGPLTLDVAAPGTVDLPASSTDVNLGRSGGRANLFGSPVNGLGGANSVDVTVNLSTKINSIARQVDGSYPGTAGGGGVNETTGNIAAYFNCRQAWTGWVQNYLTGIQLAGSLKIAPAITADGKLRIAKVSLSTPTGKEAKVAVAACLSPYQLYAEGKAGLGDNSYYPAAPTLPAGNPAFFNPLAAIESAVAAEVPDVPCNDPGGPLDRDPFNVSPIPGANILDAGAAVAVSGDLSVEHLGAEVLIGNV